MNRSRVIALGAVLAILLPCAGHAAEGGYPNKRIRAIVTTPPGGGVDMVARLVSKELTAAWGQPVVVDNRGGANGVIGVELAAQAPADGYTLLFIGNNFWAIPMLKSAVPYDPVKDFTPVTLAVRAPNILVVTPSLPAKSVQELVALAKAQPGKLNYAAGSAGSTIHLAAELFKAMAGVDVVYIPYKGAGPAMAEVMAGNAQMMFGLSVLNHVRAERLRALGIATAKPSELAPNLPTIASAGLPGFESAAIYSVMVKSGTAPDIVSRLNRAIVSALTKPEVKALLFADATEVVASSPQMLAETVASEMTKWGAFIKSRGIRAD
jgi:tripartite-type tricarboxylate transporter receptor subunit TctC